MTRKEILDELSISVACLFDDAEVINGQDIIKAEVKDIEHIQDLITKLENQEDENI
jgi:Zn-finger domain-containing protein